MNLDERFMRELAKTTSPEVFLGVARILKVPLLDENKDPRDFALIWSDTIDAYTAAGRKRRRELFKILKDANKNGD